MAVMYNQTTRTARLNQVLTSIDSGGAGSPAKLVIGTGPAPAIGTTLAELELNHPSFAVSGDTLNLSITPAVETGAGGAAATGTAAAAQIRDGSNAVVVFGLTVGTTTAQEVQLNSTAISAGQTVTITGGTITHSNSGVNPT